MSNEHFNMDAGDIAVVLRADGTMIAASSVTAECITGPNKAQIQRNMAIALGIHRTIANQDGRKALYDLGVSDESLAQLAVDTGTSLTMN